MKLSLQLKGAVSGVMGAYVNSIIGLAGMAIQAALAVRLLPPTQTGIWMLMLSLVVLLNLSDFGLSPTLSRLVSFSLHLPKKDLRVGLFFTATKRVNRLISTIVLMAITLFLALVLYSKGKLASVEIVIAVAVFIGSIYFRLLANPNLALIFGLKQVALSYRLRTTGQFLNIIVLCLLCLIKVSLVNFSLALLIQYFVLYAWSSVKAKQLMGVFVARFSKAHFKRLLDQSMRVFLMGVGAYIIFEINTPILSLYVSLSAITQFAVLLQLISLIGTMSLITQATTIPYISAMYAQQKNTSLRLFVFACMKFNMFIAATVCVFLYFHASQFFHLWLGSNYIVNKPLLLLLLIVLLFQVQDASLVTIAVACGYLKFVLITFCSGIINVLLLFLLVPHYGIVGAGMSILAAQLVTNNWYSVFVICKRVNVGIHFAEFFMRYLLPFLMYFCLLVSCGYWLGKAVVFNQSSIISLVFSALVFLLISGILAWALLIKKSERSKLVSIFKTKLG